MNQNPLLTPEQGPTTMWEIEHVEVEPKGCIVSMIDKDYGYGFGLWMCLLNGFATLRGAAKKFMNLFSI
ncbi:hypothetical protein R6Q59_033739 [Mikania micrantha]